MLGSLIGRADLSSEQTAWAMGQILAGEASPAQIAGFAVALRAKGETIDEMEGLVEAMYAAATPLAVDGRVLDVVGTGGDRSFSVNISTMAAIVAAGAGVTVVKHGNRSASSKAGSADVLEQLGIRLDLPGRRRRPGRRRGRHHLLLRRRLPPGAAARRRARAATSASAPASTSSARSPTRPGPHAQAIGCADRRMAPVMAGVFARRGVDAWVFRGDDGLDELTTTTTSSVWVVSGGEVAEHTLDPAALGIPQGTAEGLRGQDAAYNAEVVRRLLGG